jgi:hypothetical protein
VVLINRELAVVLSVAVGVLLGIVWFTMHGVMEPIPEIDVRFYFTLYAIIGGISGFFSWFIATLIEDKEVHLGCALFILAIPYSFVLWLSLDLNSLTACAVTVLFVLSMIQSYLVARRTHGKTCLPANVQAQGESRQHEHGGKSESPPNGDSRGDVGD